MKAIFDQDLEQLARINAAIAAIEARPLAERPRSELLLRALQNERVHLMKYARRAGLKRMPPQLRREQLVAVD